MVTKTTIEMAREAAGDDWGLFQEYMPEIHRLAELVRADERARMAEQPTTTENNGGKTGWPPGLLQDDCKGLSKWLSNRPDAKRRVREALAEQPAQQYSATSDHRLMKQPAQQEPIHVPVTDNTYGYAKSLAEAIFKQHFASDEHYASGRVVWGVNDTVIGILTQIDNMVADMVRKPSQQQPVAVVSGYYGGQCVILPIDPARIFNSNTALYTSPPQRTWVGLSEQEAAECWSTSTVRTWQAIEAKLKEKNT